MKIKLRKENDRNIFVAESDFSQKDVLKEAGFSWNPDVNGKFWYTADPTVAVKLVDFADERARTEILSKARSELDFRTRSVIDSRAVSTDIKIPCRPEASFSPRQLAGIKYSLDHTRTLYVEEDEELRRAAAIGLINALDDCKTFLIVCDDSEVKAWTSALSTYGTRELSLYIMRKDNPPNKMFIREDIIITTYSVFSRNQNSKVRQLLTNKNYGLLILDEAECLVSDRSGRAKAILGEDGRGSEIRANRRKLYLADESVFRRAPGPSGIPGVMPIVRSLEPEVFKSNHIGRGELIARMRSICMYAPDVVSYADDPQVAETAAFYEAIGISLPPAHSSSPVNKIDAVVAEDAPAPEAAPVATELSMVAEDAPTSAEIPAPEEAPAPRKRGRPSLGAQPLTAAERKKRHAEAHRITPVDLSGAMADRLRAMRSARGMTTEQLLAAALDALELVQQTQAA